MNVKDWIEIKKRLAAQENAVAIMLGYGKNETLTTVDREALLAELTRIQIARVGHRPARRR